MRRSCDLGGGICWLAAGDIPNPLQKEPFFVLRACVYAPRIRFIYGSLRVCASYRPFWCLLFCFLSFLFVVFVLFLLLCSRWSFVDIPLIVSCPADDVPDWQPRTLLGMVEARSVNVKNIHTHIHIYTHTQSRGSVSPLSRLIRGFISKYN